jgi:hypothetical protein
VRRRHAIAILALDAGSDGAAVMCGWILFDAGAQRIVVFIGSPVVEDEKTLTKIGKLLKKNNVRVARETSPDPRCCCHD